ncbi:hypothetical protein [Mesorhizobium sp. M0074]
MDQQLGIHVYAVDLRGFEKERVWRDPVHWFVRGDGSVGSEQMGE